MRKISGILVASALVASIALVAPAAHAGESITGSGSSYMNSMQQTCSANYKRDTRDDVSYTSKGSSTGKSEFASGATNFGGTDSLYSSGAPKNFVYVPLVGGPIAIVFNVSGVKSLNLTPALMSGIFTGKITKWNDAKIKSVNAAVASKLPNKTIQVVFRSDGSGTTNNFGAYMASTVGGKWKAADAWADASGSTKGTGAAKNAGIVTTVKGLANSISYADLADVTTAGIPFAAIQNPTGKFVKPTVAASARFLAASPIAANGQVLFNYKKKVEGGYNLTLVAYGLAPTKGGATGTAAAESVRKYFTYFINTCAPKEAAKIGYVAISGALKTKAIELVKKIK
jgi:phosphate transport system substrate-binding protein